MNQPFQTDSELAAAATAEASDFATLIAGVPYEKKGILYSEMFFLFLCANRAAPGRILESGRARGQSTELLARMFPLSPIISVEFDEKSPDAPVAARRLASFSNVDLRFGDATRLLPQLVQDGDIVLIDGPKGFRGVRLALAMLATGRPSLVFIHDSGIGTAERAFLDEYVPGCLFSDNRVFATVTHHLDAAIADTIPHDNRFREGQTAHGYGYGMACLPRDDGVRYRTLLFRAVIAGLKHRIFERGAP